MTTRQLKITKSKIKEHWYKKLKQMGKISNLLKPEFLASDYCFACLRNDGSVDRAHIHAHMDGGEDTPENLHLLCRACHRLSEAYTDEVYWKWFMQQNAMHSMLYDITRYSGISTQFIYDFFIKDKLEKIAYLADVKMDHSTTEGVADWVRRMKILSKYLNDNGELTYESYINDFMQRK